MFEGIEKQLNIMITENIDLLVILENEVFLDVLINLKLFSFSIPVVESIFKLQDNHLFKLMNNNHKFKKYILKNKLKLQYLINTKCNKIQQLINNNDNNNDNDLLYKNILSFKNTKQLIQNITKLQLQTIDFNNLLKNTTPNNINKLVSFVVELYEKFKDELILQRFLKIDKLNNKPIELLFEYILDHKIQFNLTCVIEDYIKKEIRFAIVKNLLINYLLKLIFLLFVRRYHLSLRESKIF